MQCPTLHERAQGARHPWLAVLVVTALTGATSLADASPRAPSGSDLAALRQGFQAFRAGDYAGTLTLLAPLSEVRWANADYVDSLIGQSYFLTEHYTEALRYFQGARGRFAGVARWRAADCLFELGRDAEARAAYQKLLGENDNDGERAVVLSRLAQLSLRAGKKAEAVAQLRTLYLDHPAHPVADDVPAQLRALVGKSAVVTPRDRLRRAQLLTESRRWDQAMIELAAIPADVSADVRDLVTYWTGETLFKMRRQYGRAGELLLQVWPRMGARSMEALFHGARALSRADRDDEAIRWYQKLVREHPESDWAPEAQYLSGWLEYNRGKFAESLPGLEQLLTRYPGSKFVTNAQWFLGFARWMLGKPQEALPYFEKLAARGGELVGGKGRYWKARCLAALGREAEAVALWRSIPASWPLSYYAQLARMQLAQRKLPVGAFGDKMPAPRGMTLAPAGDKALAAADELRRVDELLAAGLTVEAGDELRRVESTLIKRHGARTALPALFERYHRAENFNRPYLLGEVYGSEALSGPPQGAARIWWEVTHPLAYRELVEKYQALGKNPPYYIYTIMKKESGFNAHDASYADALGLLQMIPPTTRKVARALGIEYSDDLLYDPERNIKTGAWYIGRLVQKFGGQLPLGAGSFNAGPKAMMRWVDRHGKRPFDEFVELIAFEQSREYIKKVVGIYSRYLYLYAGQDFALEPAVNPRYRTDDGIEY